MRRRRVQTLKPIRTVLLGKDGVGKSALTVRFLTRRFIGEYDKTLESTYHHDVEVDNESIPVEIFDTAGENTDEKLRQCIRQSDLFLVLYSIDDRLSFKEAKRIVKFLRDNKSADSISLAIVATKCDLEHFRVVQFEEGWKLSDQVDCTFYEISNAEGYKEVQDLFRAFLRNFLRRRDKKPDTLLKVPSIIKRTPSFERKKKSGREQAKSAAVSPAEKNAEAKNEEECGYNAEDRLNNNTPNGHCKHVEIIASSKDRIWQTQQNGGSSTRRVKSPFDVEKIKGSSREKRQLLPSTQGPSEEHPKLGPNLIKVQKVKGSSASEWMRPLPAELTKAPLLIDREKDRQSKTKGPFFMDKLRSPSASSIRSATANEKPRSSSSLSRVREGFNLIGKTRSLRRKPIVL